MDETNPAAFGRPEYGTGLEIHPKIKLEDTLKDIQYYETVRKDLLESATPDSLKELAKVDRELGTLKKMADVYRQKLGMQIPGKLKTMPPAEVPPLNDEQENTDTLKKAA